MKRIVIRMCIVLAVSLYSTALIIWGEGIFIIVGALNLIVLNLLLMGLVIRWELLVERVLKQFMDSKPIIEITFEEVEE